MALMQRPASARTVALLGFVAATIASGVASDPTSGRLISLTSAVMALGSIVFGPRLRTVIFLLGIVVATVTLITGPSWLVVLAALLLMSSCLYGIRSSTRWRVLRLGSDRSDRRDMWSQLDRGEDPTG